MNTTKKPDAELTEAEIVERYYPLVKKIAGRFARQCRTGALNFDDLIQVGLMALIDAFRRMDWKRGTTFMTFVHPYISGYMRSLIRYRRDTIRIPHTIRGEDLERAADAMRPLNIEQQIAVERHPDTNPLVCVTRSEKRERIDELLAHLTPFQRQAVENWMAGKTHAALALTLGCTREAVRLTFQAALDRLQRLTTQTKKESW